ncbi:hypothetical protein OROGR_019010 [Orobanche gracilis]
MPLPTFNSQLSFCKSDTHTQISLKSHSIDYSNLIWIFGHLRRRTLAASVLDILLVLER